MFDEISDLIMEYIHILILTIVGIIVLVVIFIPIGNFIPDFNSLVPFLKNKSISQWLLGNTFLMGIFIISVFIFIPIAIYETFS